MTELSYSRHVSFLLDVVVVILLLLWLSFGHELLRATSRSHCISIRFICTRFIMDVWNFAVVNKWNVGVKYKDDGDLPVRRSVRRARVLLLVEVKVTEVAVTSYITPNANVSLKAIEQFASPSAAEETPRAVWGSIPSRHGRRIFWIAGVHTNALRSAQPEGYSGSDPLPSSNISFVHTLTPLCSFIQMSREQELGLDRNRKKFDAREEYFVSLLSSFDSFPLFLSLPVKCDS